MRTEIIEIITSFLGTLGFAILFNVKGKRLIAASFGGFLSWTIFLLLGKIIPSEPVCYLLVSTLISFYAEIIARVLKTPTTTVLMTALIPLVPGASLYYTMAYALGSDVEKFLEKALATLQLAGALALGIVITTMVMHTLYAIQIQHKKKESYNGND